MKIEKFRSSGLLVLATAFLMLIPIHNLQGQQFRTTTQTRYAIDQLETNMDRFSNTVDSALDKSRLNNTDLEDQVNALVDELEYATDQLKDRAHDDIVNQLDVNEVLRKGMYLDMFMKRNSLSPAAQRDWRQVRNDLDGLARVYRVTWTWVPNSMVNSPLSKSWTRQVVQRLEDTSDQFRSSFDSGLDQSRFDGSSYEDFMNKVVAKFEDSIDKLKDDANSSRALNQDDLRITLNNANAIDDFLRRNTFPVRTRRDWARVRANLDDLAFLNRVAWTWRVTRDTSTAMARTNNTMQGQGERVGLSSRMSSPETNMVAREVRHELLSDLPYYTVFDWIEFEVLPDHTVILRGEVTSPPDTKSRAAQLTEDVSGVNRVVNEIRILPVSPNDDRLRRALYNEIYGFNSPLFRYGIGSRQAIHLIVDRGRATLKGEVETQADKDLAYARARGVSGLFSVTNDLKVKGEGMFR